MAFTQLEWLNMIRAYFEGSPLATVVTTEIRLRDLLTPRAQLLSRIRYNFAVTSGQLIRQARKRKGLSQAELAFRAGTRQSAISRLERGDISPSVETLESLLRVMGERLELSSQPAERDYDRLHRKAMAKLSPEERLAQAISWNRVAGEFLEAGRKARQR
jgi:transcriptional regulator with XRE-family HTH domain